MPGQTNMHRRCEKSGNSWMLMVTGASLIVPGLLAGDVMAVVAMSSPGIALVLWALTGLKPARAQA